MISETYRCPCGPWAPTPRWMFWKPAYRRSLYAWPQIGGGWDGYEYADRIPVVAGTPPERGSE